MSTTPASVLILDMALLGDLVLGLRANAVLRQLDPAPKTWWVVNAAYTDLVKDQPGVAGVLGLPKYQQRMKSFLRSVPFVRGAKPDLTLVMHDSFYAALIARWGSGQRWGYDTQGRGWLLNHALEKYERDHLWERRAVILKKALGLGVPDGPWLHVPETWQEGLPVIKGPFALVNVHASWASKKYPLALMAQVVRLVREARPHLTWLAIAGPGEEEELARFQELVPGGIPFAGALKITQLAVLLQRSSLLLTNDSGPMHLAQAVGCPVVVPFGPTDPALCGPIGDRHRVLQHAVPCAPCYDYTCAQPQQSGGAVAAMACMTGIEEDAVAGACLELLGGV